MPTFVPGVFQPSADVTKQMLIEVSTLCEAPAQLDPLLWTLFRMGIRTGTIAESLPVTGTAVSHWTVGRFPVPEHRRAQLVKLIRVARQLTLDAIKDIKSGPQSAATPGILAIMRGRVQLADAALEDFEHGRK